MNGGSVNLSKMNMTLTESSLSDKHAKLRAVPLLVISVILFFGYVTNVLLGMLAIQYAMDVPYLDDIWEFLMMLGASVGFMAFVLMNESDNS